MKKVYDFHHSMVNKHIDELDTVKETVIKSYFLFDLFKKQYDKAYTITKIKSQKIFKFVCSTTRKTKDRYPNYKYILHLINTNCINCEQVKYLLEKDYYWNAKNITHNDIDNLFDKKTDKNIRYEILDKLSDKYCKFGIISGFECSRFYYKINLQN